MFSSSINGGLTTDATLSFDEKGWSVVRVAAPSSPPANLRPKIELDSLTFYN